MAIKHLFITPFFLLILGCAIAPNHKTPKVIENSLAMKMVLVPAGEFLMGSDESPESLQRDFPQYPKSRLTDLNDEKPVHLVKISKPFFMGQYEVTVDQFRKFLDESGYIPESIADKTGGYGYNADYDPALSIKGDAFEGRNQKYLWSNPGFKQLGSEPVLNVTWNDAVALTQWLSHREGKTYRLPTEAEWEYACRAGTQSRYFNGDNPEALIDSANIFDADSAKNWQHWDIYALKKQDSFAFTAPVGSFKPNAFGIYDMSGNAWEWVSDWYDEEYYAHSASTDPQGPKEGNVKVRRGGSWHTWALYARSSYRNWNSRDTRYALVGMRLVLEVDTKH
jgi:formylglycine-generating enzyme required for sulfatase activity